MHRMTPLVSAMVLFLGASLLQGQIAQDKDKKDDRPSPKPATSARTPRAIRSASRSRQGTCPITTNRKSNRTLPDP